MLHQPVRSATLIAKRSQLSSSIIPRSQTRTMASNPTRYKLVFFSPLPNIADVKTAVFATGAGTYPNYSECCFTTPGVGQFRPGDSANPTIGAKGQLEEVGEARCEMVCNGREITEKAVAALKKAHPYEEPAYEVYKLEDF